MINLKDTLAEDITVGIKEAQKAGDLPAFEDMPTIVVNYSPDVEHGDYATPVALSLAKTLKMDPMKVVEVIATHMPKKEYVGKLKAAAPGFLNIWLNPGWLTSRLDNMVEDDLSSDIKDGNGKTVNLEFISANPTGPLTLGNARTAFSVDTLGNVLSCAGFGVVREYYFNDTGAQVKRLGESVLRRILQSQGEEVEFAEDLYQGEYIKEVASRVAEYWKEIEGKEFEAGDLENKEVLKKISEQSVEIFLTEIKSTITDDLKIEFDVWTSEHQIRESGIIKEALDTLAKKGMTYEKDGALWFKATELGQDQDKVLIKSDGEYAYITPDIGYHQTKYNRGFDAIFTFVGADHIGQVPMLKAAMKALDNDVTKLHFVVAQWIRLTRGTEQVKLSKRAGQVYGPKDLIDEIGYDAARFFLVQYALSSHMDLDLELAKERSERNPVYYVQYAYVRMQSILRRAKEEGFIDQIGVTMDMSSSPALTHTFELALIKMLYRWPETISEIARTNAVHHLPYYAYDLAKAIHVFYKEVPVLKGASKDIIQGRLQLVLAARKVLGETLDLIGISKPDVM